MINETSAGIVIYYEGKTRRSGGSLDKIKNNVFARHQHEYLLLHYPAGHFDFPKGHIERGESERQAALRELREETGIRKIVWMPGFREKIRYRYLRTDPKMADVNKHSMSVRSQSHKNYSTKQVTFFLARVTQKKITISFEHKGSTWLPYKEALKKITYRQAKNVLKKAERLLKSAADLQQ